MIVARAPYRISFIGGGSDLRSFYEHSQGMVISATLSRYVYVSIHPNFDSEETNVKLSELETVRCVENLKHPIAKAVLKKLGVRGVEISSTGDVPARTGLGSSSSFTVGMLEAVYAYGGVRRTKEELAREACEIEIEILHEPIGKQDQYAVAYGGLNQLTFEPDGAVDIEPIALPLRTRRRLESSLLLFFTGVTRRAATVLAIQSKSLTRDSKETRALKALVEMVPSLRRELESGNVGSMGEYLHEAWQIKRSLAAGISNAEIDRTYARARELGATGGKLLGAGGGGFLLLYCPEEKQAGLIDGLGLKSLPVVFDCEGAQVICS